MLPTSLATILGIPDLVGTPYTFGTVYKMANAKIHVLLDTANSSIDEEKYGVRISAPYSFINSNCGIYGTSWSGNDLTGCNLTIDEVYNLAIRLRDWVYSQPIEVIQEKIDARDKLYMDPMVGKFYGVIEFPGGLFFMDEKLKCDLSIGSNYSKQIYADGTVVFVSDTHTYFFKIVTPRDLLWRV